MAVMGDVPFVRIGVGIGRPESRQSDDVARYVLGKMTGVEKGKIEGAAEEVIVKLKELEKG
jgi:PTH1 family peptidyl-tRNA hydrolase